MLWTAQWSKVNLPWTQSTNRRTTVIPTDMFDRGANRFMRLALIFLPHTRFKRIPSRGRRSAMLQICTWKIKGKIQNDLTYSTVTSASAFWPVWAGGPNDWGAVVGAAWSLHSVDPTAGVLWGTLLRAGRSASASSTTFSLPQAVQSSGGVGSSASTSSIVAVETLYDRLEISSWNNWGVSWAVDLANLRSQRARSRSASTTWPRFPSWGCLVAKDLKLSS